MFQKSLSDFMINPMDVTTEHSISQSMRQMLDESWNVRSVEQQAGGYGINSPKGTIYIGKSKGKDFKVEVSRSKQDKDTFKGNSEQVAKWLNDFFGLT